MSIWLYVLLVLWIAYAIFISKLVRKAFRKNIRYLLEIDPNEISTCQASSRYDFSSVSETKLILGAIFLLPIRALTLIPLLTVALLFAVLNNVILRIKDDDTTSFKIKIMNFVTTYVSKFPILIWYLTGTWVIKKTKVRINDLIAEYKPIQNTDVAPVAVANHCGWFEIAFLFSMGYSFLMKKSLTQNPIVSAFSKPVKCLSIERGEDKDREKVKEDIHHRVKCIMRGDPLKPLLIFAEGTVSNGKDLLSFKKGPFMDGAPLKIFALKYDLDYNRVCGSIANIDGGLIMLIIFSQLVNRMEIIEFEDNLDPQWVYKKYNVQKEDENAWEYVAKEVKDLIAFAGGFGKTEYSFRQVNDFYKASKEYNKKLVEADIQGKVKLKEE